MASWEEFSRIVAEAKASKKLDPVGHEDDDVDNDGDSDSSDSYLKKRRATVGAAIAADRKKKVSEALDPVGHEDKDIDNDGDHDKSDKYLLNRRKVRAKVIPPQERLKTDRDMFNIPKSEQEAARERILAKTKAKRMKEEVEQIDEIAPLVVAGGLAAAAATPYLLKKFAKPAVDKAIDKQRSTKPSDYAVPAQKGGLGAITARMRTGGIPEDYQQNSYQPEGQMVDENKEHDREMRKAAARERAEEKREKKEGGKKSAKSPGRLGKSAGSSYADKEQLSIKGHDEVTKKAGHTVGNPFPEHVELTYEAKKSDYLNDKLPSDEKLGYGFSDNKKRVKDLKKLKRLVKHYDGMKKGDPMYNSYQPEGEQIEEKALSRAQQRFMGMVYAAKKGETPASPEVAKAASGISKKAARDFAKTKHEGLPEKKEETKEELSLVDKIIEEVLNEAPKGTISGGKSKAKKYKAVAKQAKLAAAVNKIMKGDKEQDVKKSEEERKEAAKKEVKSSKKGRGMSDPSALTRRASVAGATRLKAEREKTKRQRERQQYERERRAEKSAERTKREKEKQASKQKDLEKKSRERIRKSEESEQTKKEQEISAKRKKLSQKTSKPPELEKVHEKDTVASGTTKMVGNVGKVVGYGAKLTVAAVKAARLKRQAKKESEKRQEMSQRHEVERKKDTQESFSNWREEFIFEVDDQSIKEPQQKVIDVSKKKNKIEINPNMSEGCGCDEKEKQKTLKKDMRELPTEVNLVKNKMRSMGVKNPMVMVVSKEETEIEEGMTLKDFKKKRSAQKQKEKRAAEKTSPLRRAGIHDDKASPERDARHRANVDPDFDGDDSVNYPGGKLKNPKKIRKAKALGELGESAAWTKKEGKSEAGGLNEKGRKSYERENPGSDLKAPSKKVGNPRRASFCSRMKGMKEKLTSAKTANDPDSRINKSLRAWNC